MAGSFRGDLILYGRASKMDKNVLQTVHRSHHLFTHKDVLQLKVIGNKTKKKNLLCCKHSSKFKYCHVQFVLN